jgi:3-hydroxyisobutyrate dehydrogenase-like beta-hydroxyacid dehydrogenase
MNEGLPSVGFLGLGIMGSRMAANLAAAGYPLTVWTHTPGKAATWAADHAGTTAVDTPAEVGAACDVAVTILVDGDQVAATLTGPDGVLAGATAPLLCVDMSTIGAAAARAIGADVVATGGAFVDAPVTGSSPKAEAGTLTIMAGGAAADVERARPLFDVMGSLVVHVGELGQGQMLKLINNAVAAANAATLAQALVAADATGVPLEHVSTVLGAGAGGSTMLDLKAGPMREHDYTTLFKLDHMLKDVRLCLEETRAAGVAFPAAAAAGEAMTAASGRGFGDADFAAVVEAYEGLSGRRLPG